MLQVIETTKREIDEIDEAILKEQFTSINDATFRLNFKHAQYTRRLVLEGKLDAIKVQHKHYPKWWIAFDSINDYLENNTRSGNRRFILRTELENEDKVRAALDKLEIEYDLELAYQPKDK